MWLVCGQGRLSCGNAGGPGICTVVFNSALGKENQIIKAMPPVHHRVIKYKMFNHVT